MILVEDLGGGGWVFGERLGGGYSTSGGSRRQEAIWRVVCGEEKSTSSASFFMKGMRVVV